MNGADTSRTGETLIPKAAWNGVVSRRHLEGLGLSSNAFDWQVRRGRLLPIGQGAYAVGRPVEGERATLAAALVVAGPEAALAGRSAAAIWRILEWTSMVDIVRSEPRRPARFRLDGTGLAHPRWVSVRQSRFLGPEDVTRVAGFPVTTVPRTLLDMAGRVDYGVLQAAFDEAGRRNLLRRDELERFLRRGSGWQGIGRYRAAVRGHLPRVEETESALEVKFLRLCSSAAIPMPEPNQSVLEFRVDCLWRDSKLVVELDGYEFHQGRAAFERDRERDSRLRLAGYRVLRFTWRQIEGRPEKIVALLMKELEYGPGGEQTATGERSAGSGPARAR